MSTPTTTPTTTRVAPPVDLPTPAAVAARAPGENFTVASRLLPAGARAHLLAFYGYARFVDELGDDYAGDRATALDWLEAEVDLGLGGAPVGTLHPLVGPAVAAVVDLGADPAPLRDLIEANRRDQATVDCATWGDLLDYCRLSANPVGRLVLAAFDASTPARVAWSDAVCSALQVVEHLQDLAEDRAAGRIYLPAEDRVRFAVAPGDLDATRGAGHTGLRALVAFEAARARRLLDDGTPLVASLRGRARLAVAGFVAGGLATLDALAAAGYDPIARTVAPSPLRTAWHSARLLATAR